MAKLSLSWALNRRKRIRVITGLAVLLLLFAGISMMISKNPKGTRAGTCISSWGGDACSSGTYQPTVYTFRQNYIFEDSKFCKATITNGIGICSSSWYSLPNNADEFEFRGSPTQSTIIMRGSNYLPVKLTVNNAIITHERLVPGDDFAIANSDLTTEGKKKKVDLEINGDLILQSDGQVDVNGKGYPGAYYTISSDLVKDLEPLFWKGQDLGPSGAYGWGPGGGRHESSIGVAAGGGGGSFGGQGGPGGNATSTPRSPTYPVDLFTSPDLNFGSGGGSAWSKGGADVSYGNGGNGGGRVKIVAKSIDFQYLSSKITANGSQGFAWRDDNNGISTGGGSGGAIKIVAEKLIYGEYSKVQASAKGADLGGWDGTISVNGFDVDVVFQISADGGLWGDAITNHNGPGKGGGGGGYIMVDKISNQPITIKKTLYPYKREGAELASACNPTIPPEVSADNCFNPYALQKNDEIVVKLEISNIVAGALNIKDEVLQVPYATKKIACKPDFTIRPMRMQSDTSTSLDHPANYDELNKLVNISYTASITDTTVKFWYWCKVSED